MVVLPQGLAHIKYEEAVVIAVWGPPQPRRPAGARFRIAVRQAEAGPREEGQQRPGHHLAPIPHPPNSIWPDTERADPSPRGRL